jgi:hypothetical protein
MAEYIYVVDAPMGGWLHLKPRQMARLGPKPNFSQHETLECLTVCPGGLSAVGPFTKRLNDRLPQLFLGLLPFLLSASRSPA